MLFRVFFFVVLLLSLLFVFLDLEVRHKSEYYRRRQEKREAGRWRWERVVLFVAFVLWSLSVTFC